MAEESGEYVSEEWMFCLWLDCDEVCSVGVVIGSGMTGICCFSCKVEE